MKNKQLANANLNAPDKGRKPPTADYRQVPGAPPNAYFFTVVGVAFVLATILLATFIYFGPQAIERVLDPATFERWKAAHRGWYFLAFLAALALDIAACDVLGWKVATWIAAARRDGNVTARKVAVMRIAVQMAFIALMALLYAVVPAYLPHPHGHLPYFGLCIPGAAIAMAAIQLFRASKNPEMRGLS